MGNNLWSLDLDQVLGSDKVLSFTYEAIFNKLLFWFSDNL